MPEQILTTARDFWAMLIGVCGLIVWFVRLEGRAKRNSDELRDHKVSVKEQRAEDIANHARDRVEMNKTLGSIQSDIRELLQRTSK